METAGWQPQSEAGSRAHLFWGVFAAWALWTGLIYLQPAARSYDETWFLQLAQARSPADTLNAGAQLGYGQLYWLLSAQQRHRSARVSSRLDLHWQRHSCCARLWRAPIG